MKKIIILSLMATLIFAKQDNNNLLLLQEIAKEYAKVEKQKKEVKKIIPTKTKEQQTLETIKRKKLDSKRIEANKIIASKQPIPIGYYSIDNKKIARVIIHRKYFNLRKNDEVAGFKVLKITKNYVKFLTPYEEEVKIPYMRNK